MNIIKTSKLCLKAYIGRLGQQKVTVRSVTISVLAVLFLCDM